MFIRLIFSFIGLMRDTIGEATMYLTTVDQQQLLSPRVLLASDKVPTNSQVIRLNPSKTFQEMDGFGFTLTGGSAMHLSKMDKGARGKLLKELFGTGKGEIGISYLRLSIGASDLDEYPWSYLDLPKGKQDLALKNYSPGYDTLYLIPVLKEILAISPHIQIMGSPWSPPSWMKDNKDSRGGSLLPEYYDVYARYLVKYIQSMNDYGIDISALTIQNEPLHPGNNPSLLMLAGEQKEFIKAHLGPAFAKNNINTRIIIYDHNANRPDYPISILDDPEAAKYIDGSAFHLYEGEIGALSKVHDAHPAKNIYFTEQWIGGPGNFAGDYSWHIRNLIIGGPKNWAKTVLQWNLTSNTNYTPHTDRGGCTRCLGAVTIEGSKVTRNSAYYIIGQIAPFVRPGYHRIESNNINDIEQVAFSGPKGKVVLITQNISSERKVFYVKHEENHFPIALDAGAVATLVIE
ncbi:MAG: glycoside hydrolase family 30 protein [Bacteroidota bacterium]